MDIPIELLIVIAILTVLSSAVAVMVLGKTGHARDGVRKADLRQLSDYLRAYYYDHGFTYPADNPPYFSTDVADPWIPELAPDYDKPMPRDPKQEASLVNSLAGKFNMLLLNKNIMINHLVNLFDEFIPKVNITYADIPTTLTFPAIESERLLNDSHIQSFTLNEDWPPDPPPVGNGNCSSSFANNTQDYIGMWRRQPVASIINYAWRYYFEFDTSAIPDDATIESAKITFNLETDESSNDFDINLREFNYDSVVDCADWNDANFLATAPVNETRNTLNLPNPFDLNFSPSGFSSIKKGTNAISSFGMSSSLEEDNNYIPNVEDHEWISVYSHDGGSVSQRPVLTVSYTTPIGGGGSGNGGGPGPGDPGYGVCGDDPKVYCYAYYYNVADSSYTLWTWLEDKNDKQIWNGANASCAETPPKTYFDYCTK